MDKIQADAVVQAILEPDLQAQTEIHRKKAAEALQLAKQQQMARFTLVGFGVGATAAYFISYGISAGGIWGGFAGSVIGWFTKRHAA